MSTGTILKQLRDASMMTQAQLADKVHVTRQAVSRWENGETIPGADLLVKLSEVFGVSIDALLESPVIRYCECCGMPLEPSIMGKNKEGEIDPGYCKWCLEDGSFVYTEPDQMLDFLVASMPQNGLSEKECRAFYASHLKKLPYWKGKMTSDSNE
ncbi:MULTISPECIES: helix-turn-helix domain-containing protein [Allobaculum]|uniref:helix-turn-helix domain-containing protein n=1 Tax=Allobaculum TaxID=174708 RepID=UPI001E475957|nr:MULTISPECIES: zinc ribbon domain-containing protein [Allobaculum]UNT93645.1 helix-turn-helix domain-containing protein [Allobaculum sp. Allo2]